MLVSVFAGKKLAVIENEFGEVGLRPSVCSDVLDRCGALEDRILYGLGRSYFGIPHVIFL